MRKLFKSAAVLIILLGFLTQPAAAATTPTYQWQAPTTGTPVHHYEVAVSMDSGEFVALTVEPTSTSVTLHFEDNKEYTVRVRGVDASGSAGLWSPASEPYSHGAPGACGKPYVVD